MFHMVKLGLDISPPKPAASAFISVLSGVGGYAFLMLTGQYTQPGCNSNTSDT